jgi:hypothetical protein
MEYLYRCTTRGCSWLNNALSKGQPYETTANTKAVNPACKHCKLHMKGPLAPGPVVVARPFDYDAAVAKVRAKLAGNASQPTKDYCEAVMTSLLKYADSLKAAFVEDMKHDAHLAVFVSPSRANDDQKKCVDNAVTEAKAPKAAGHPVGEKFDWEIPYIMNVAGWQIASGPEVAWVDMSEVLQTIAKGTNGTQYLVSAKFKAKADGHTILVTRIDKTLWVSDRQKQLYDYRTCDCIAWSRPGTVAAKDVPGPKRKITTEAKLDGNWMIA